MIINDAQFEIMQRIGKLLYHRLQDNLSEAERIELEEWLDKQDLSTREFFQEVTEWDRVQEALHEMYSVDVDSALKDVQKKIEFEAFSAVEMQPKQGIVRMRLYRRLGVAAMIALVVGAGGMFYLNRHIKKVNPADLPVAQRFKNEVPAGGEKAILQLADGSRIVLDSVSNGELAKQGATKVIKLEDGQLAYHAGGAASPVESFNTITTPKGGQYQVVLPDGSKVWLNAASSLRFPTAFNGDMRTVVLSGEAYFQVAKNATIPFRVDVATEGQTLQVDVLGTEFNIMAYADETDQKTTLLNGAIKVSAGGRQLVLDPGQQARVGSPASALQLAKDINTEEVTAWKDGRFQFQEAPIEGIMRQVSRWYNVDVVYDGKVEQQFTGKIPREVNLTTLLKILEATGWVHFMIEGKKITVMR